MVEKQPPKFTVIEGGGKGTNSGRSPELTVNIGGLSEEVVLSQKPPLVYNPTENELLVLSDYVQRLQTARKVSGQVLDWVYEDLENNPPSIITLYRALYAIADDAYKVDRSATYVRYIEEAYAPLA